MTIYAGIGSRTTPPRVIHQMMEIGRLGADRGWGLRSGGADGADLAFENGCDDRYGLKQVFIPWNGFNFKDNDPEQGIMVLDDIEASKIAAKFHPAWNSLSNGVRKLHSRNVFQVLGPDLDLPCDFIVCYTADGRASGGTGQALRIAKAYDIPIYNLQDERNYQRVLEI